MNRRRFLGATATAAAGVAVAPTRALAQNPDPSPEMSALSTYMSEAANRPLLLESKYDRQFKAVFDTIRELMAHSTPQTRRPIGFTSWTDEE